MKEKKIEGFIFLHGPLPPYSFRRERERERERDLMVRPINKVYFLPFLPYKQNK